MRDDRAKWQPRVETVAHRLNSEVELNKVTDLQLTMISGVSVLDNIDAPIVGWPDVNQEERYAVAMRRDRVLLAGECDLNEGWDAGRGWAVSDMTHGYDIFDLSGPAALGLLRQGTEIELDKPSKSAVRLAFGLGLHIYRHRDESTFRLHVLSHQSTALVGFLKAAAKGA